MARLTCSNEDCPGHYRDRETGEVVLDEETGRPVEPYAWETDYTNVIVAYHGAPPAEYVNGYCDRCGSAGVAE